jgi:hypothetical protein
MSNRYILTRTPPSTHWNRTMNILEFIDLLQKELMSRLQKGALDLFDQIIITGMNDATYVPKINQWREDGSLESLKEACLYLGDYQGDAKFKKKVDQLHAAQIAISIPTP